MSTWSSRFYPGLLTGFHRLEMKNLFHFVCLTATIRVELRLTGPGCPETK